MKKLKLTVLIILMLFALSACSRTQMTNVWQNDAAIAGQSYDKVLVICITRTMVVRKQVEDQFVKHLQNKGAEAVSSYTIIRDHNDLKKEIIVERTKGMGFDAALVTSLVDIKSQEHFSPSGPGTDGFYGNMYEYSNRRLGSGSGYLHQERKVILETNVYEVKTENLIWSGASETNLKASNAVKSYTNAAMKNMSGAGLFQ